MVENSQSDAMYDAMTDACIEAGERVMEAGSPALQAAMRVVLSILGRDVAERAHAVPPRGGGGASDADDT